MGFGGIKGEQTRPSEALSPRSYPHQVPPSMHATSYGRDPLTLKSDSHFLSLVKIRLWKQ